MADAAPNKVCLELTARIVAAHVGRNATPAGGLPELIRSVYRAFAGAAAGPEAATAPARKQQPAVPVGRSVRADALVCLEDGGAFATLKRHLRTSHGLTPEQYREKCSLPASYPMVAPGYASRRSDLAKAIGLGRKKPAEPQVPPAARRAIGSR